MQLIIKMGYSNFLMLVLLLQTVKGFLDYGAIYRLTSGDQDNADNNGTTASLEVYLRTNVLGRLLRTQNGTYLEPKGSALSLGCPHVASRCSWELKGNWMKQHNEMLRSYIINLRDSDSETLFPNACENGDGGCQGRCIIINSTSLCTCPPGYHLNIDQRTCTGDNSTYQILIGRSGRLEFDRNSDTNLDYEGHYNWLIVTNQHNFIRMNFNHFSITVNEWLALYDGDNSSCPLLGFYNSTNIPTRYITSTKNKMFISFFFQSLHSSFDGYYFSEHTVIEAEAFLNLLDNVGMLRSPQIIPRSQDLCLSMINKHGSDEKYYLNVTVKTAGGTKLNMYKIYEERSFPGDESWMISRFKGTLLKHEIGRPITVSIHFTGRESSVFSILGCNSHVEDLYVVAEGIGIDEIPKLETSPEHKTDVTQQCYNGGVRYHHSSLCLCPTGFTGQMCEKPCESNSYGQDCQGICSGFLRKCYNMIFCVPNLSCMCASGLTGNYCNKECDPGYYGASCRKTCGHCLEGLCDIYTGHCKGSCKPGFFPPYCQDAYHQVAVPVVVDEVGLDRALIKANLSNHNITSYQVQFREKSSSFWSELPPGSVSSDTPTIQAEITNLQPEKLYEARMLITDQSGFSYSEDGAPTIDFETRCIVSSIDNYNLQFANVTNTSFEVIWEYNSVGRNYCVITGYEITYHTCCKEVNIHVSPNESHITLYDLFPGDTYVIKIRGLSEHGMSPYSQPIIIKTSEDLPGEVMNLNITRKGPTLLNVQWDDPIFHGGRIRQYRVEYQCLRYIACSESCSHSAGVIEASNKTQAIALADLLPYATYEVRVAARTMDLGPFKLVAVDTNYTETGVAPEMSSVPIADRSSTSFTVQWEPPKSCSEVHGSLLGYRYELMLTSGSEEYRVRTGTTVNTYVTFTNLIASSNYTVMIYLVTNAGWNYKHRLVMKVSTMATSPDEVEDLTVYKRNQHMIGVRWATPVNTYGRISSFSIMYHEADKTDTNKTTSRISPKHCAAWSELYCHTISDLKPDTRYIISVQARNTEIDIDGIAVSTKGSTFEEAPGSPTSLRVLNRTVTSLWLQWGPPRIINGILRSFILDVEHIDSLNASQCCKSFRREEIPVGEEELPTYEYEVRDLFPASTMCFTIAANTIAVGPSTNLFTVTTPEPPNGLQSPHLLQTNDSLLYPSLEIQPVAQQEGLKSTYLLLVLPPDDHVKQVLWEDEFALLLQTAVNSTFYLVDEYQQENFLENKLVSLGKDVDVHNGTFGTLQDPVLTPGTYKVGLALVLDYFGAKSVGFEKSDSFTIPQM